MTQAGVQSHELPLFHPCMMDYITNYKEVIYLKKKNPKRQLVFSWFAMFSNENV